LIPEQEGAENQFDKGAETGKEAKRVKLKNSGSITLESHASSLTTCDRGGREVQKKGKTRGTVEQGTFLSARLRRQRAAAFFYKGRVIRSDRRRMGSPLSVKQKKGGGVHAPLCTGGKKGILSGEKTKKKELQ